MSGPKVRHLLSLLLTLSAASTAALIYSDAWRLPETPRDKPQTDAPTALESAADTVVASSAPPPLQNFSEIIARPLFAPDRRPQRVSPGGQETVAKAPTTPIPGAPVSNQFQVMGIVISEDEKAALIKPVGQKGEILRVREGQLVSGWKITSITPEAVNILQDGRNEVIKLSDNKLSAAEKRRLAQQAKRKESLNKRKTAVKRKTRKPPTRKSPRSVARPTPRRAPRPPSRPPIRKPAEG